MADAVRQSPSPAQRLAADRDWNKLARSWQWTPQQREGVRRAVQPKLRHPNYEEAVMAGIAGLWHQYRFSLTVPALHDAKAVRRSLESLRGHTRALLAVLNPLPTRESAALAPVEQISSRTLCDIVSRALLAACDGPPAAAPLRLHALVQELAWFEALTRRARAAPRSTSGRPAAKRRLIAGLADWLARPGIEPLTGDHAVLRAILAALLAPGERRNLSKEIAAAIK